jgi:NADP-dependent 3-hydroxy acid dehydrogenase YdfG
MTVGSHSIRGRAALVTGASRGIGRAVALALAAEGCDVALLARGVEGLQETARACEAHDVQALCLAVDLTDDASLQAAVVRAVEAFEGIDILVNNAGIMLRDTVPDADPDDWDRMLDVNLRAVMRLTRLTLPHMGRADRGVIVNISSIAGKVTYSGGAGYCASKHGLLGFTGALFEDVRERGIKVCAVCPGFVRTDMVGEGRNLDPSKMIQPEDVAEAVLFVAKFPGTACPTELTLRPQRTPYV